MAGQNVRCVNCHTQCMDCKNDSLKHDLNEMLIQCLNKCVDDEWRMKINTMRERVVKELKNCNGLNGEIK